MTLMRHLSALPLILVLSPTAVSYAFVEARGVAATSPPGGPMAAWFGPGFAAGAYSTVMPHRAPAVRAGAITAEQDPAVVEASLGLDRPTRRLIQQGLRNDGFDPGVPDGLFGPRTRVAIRRWQEARGEPGSGYLNGAEAQLLRAAGSPAAVAQTAGPTEASEVSVPSLAPEPAARVLSATAEPVPASAPAQADFDCGEWNTQEFFETATAEAVRTCLAGGADVAALDDEGVSPLQWAAWSSGAPDRCSPRVRRGHQRSMKVSVTRFCRVSRQKNR